MKKSRAKPSLSAMNNMNTKNDFEMAAAVATECRLASEQSGLMSADGLHGT